MPPLYTPYNWTGLYVGVHGGYARSHSSFDFVAAGTGASQNGNGGFIGGRIGYNYQLPNNLVLGVEGEANWGSIKGSTACPGAGFTCGHKINAFGSVVGRVGYAFDRLLVHVNGGVAFADARYQATNTATGALFGTGYKSGFVGWTLGAGVEYAITSNLIASVDYKYYDFRSKTSGLAAVSGISAGRFHPTMHTVRAGLTYKF